MPDQGEGAGPVIPKLCSPKLLSVVVDITYK